MEKRKFTRVDQRVSVNAIVVDPSDDKTLFKLDPVWSKDVGGNGLGLVTSVHCRVGAVMDLEFQLPTREGPVHAKGRVVWSKLGDNDKEYRIGVAFYSISDEDRDAIVRYVNVEAGKASRKGV